MQRRELIHPNSAVPLVSHLTELRDRVLKSVLAIASCTLLCLFYSRDIYNWLKAPMNAALPEGSFFIATSPFESYMAYFKVSFLAGFFLASPLLFYQFFKFVSPALKQSEKKLLLPFALVAAVLFVGGSLFGYFVVFPTGFYYVNLVLEGTGIHLLPKMSDYLSVALMMLLSFGFSFELPLLMLILGRLGVLDAHKIKAMRRYVIVALFVLAAMLTPGPDVLSQCLLAVPLWLLYELGGLLLKFQKKKEST